MIRVKMPVQKSFGDIHVGQGFIDNNELYLKVSKTQAFLFSCNTLSTFGDFSGPLTVVKLTSARVMMNDEGEMSV